MEISPDTPPAAATYEPAIQSTPVPTRPLCRVSDRLADPLVTVAEDAQRDSTPGRAPREGDWTPDKIRTFLCALAECGVVEDACRAARMSRMAAYRLRNSAKGRAFHLAWRAALIRARRRLADELVSRAVNGCVDKIYRNGELVAERHRFDNRLSMDVFARLDRLLARDEVGGAVGIAAEEFEPFVELVGKGGDGAADFLRRRLPLAERNADEPELIARAENFQRYGVGLPEEIDVSDLDEADSAGWTEDQAERAARARVAEPPRSDAATSFTVYWDYRNFVPGREEPLWLPVGTTAAQALAYVRAGALGCNARNPGDAPEPAQPPAPAGDTARAEGDAAHRQPPAADGSAPGAEAPAHEPVERERATCLPHEYDPKSGLLPPHGWIAPREYQPGT